MAYQILEISSSSFLCKFLYKVHISILNCSFLPYKSRFIYILGSALVYCLCANWRRGILLMFVYKHITPQLNYLKPLGPVVKSSLKTFHIQYIMDFHIFSEFLTCRFWWPWKWLKDYHENKVHMRIFLIWEREMSLIVILFSWNVTLFLDITWFSFFLKI